MVDDSGWFVASFCIRPKKHLSNVRVDHVLGERLEQFHGISHGIENPTSKQYGNLREGFGIL